MSAFTELHNDLKSIGINPCQLKELMSEELAHFQCLINGRYVRVLTRACSFSFDFSCETVNLETQETIALHVIHHAKQQLIKKTRECADFKKANNRLSEEVVVLRQKCDELAKWKSRCMRMVSKMRKPRQKSAKAKKTKEVSRS